MTEAVECENNTRSSNDLPPQYTTTGQMQLQQLTTHILDGGLSPLTDESIHSENREGLNSKIETRPDAYGGIGLFAVVDISVGEVVLLDYPIFQCSTSIHGMYKKFNRLTVEQLHFLHSLDVDPKRLTENEINDSQLLCPQSSPNFSRFLWFVCLMKCNGHGVPRRQDRWALYPIGLRANHSCSPNVSYRNVDNCLYYIALKPIKKNEEITMTYVDTLFGSTKYRQDKLMHQKVFLCGCPRCSKGPDTCRNVVCPHCRSINPPTAAYSGSSSDTGEFDSPLQLYPISENSNESEEDAEAAKEGRRIDATDTGGAKMNHCTMKCGSRSSERPVQQYVVYRGDAQWGCDKCKMVFNDDVLPIVVEHTLSNLYSHLDTSFIQPDPQSWMRYLVYLSRTSTAVLGLGHWLSAGCSYLFCRYFLGVWYGDNEAEHVKLAAYQHGWKFFQFVETSCPEALDVDVVPWSSALMRMALICGDVQWFVGFASRYLTRLLHLYGKDDPTVKSYHEAINYLHNLPLSDQPDLDLLKKFAFESRRLSSTSEGTDSDTDSNTNSNDKLVPVTDCDNNIVISEATSVAVYDKDVYENYDASELSGVRENYEISDLSDVRVSKLLHVSETPEKILAEQNDESDESTDFRANGKSDILIGDNFRAADFIDNANSIENCNYSNRRISLNNGCDLIDEGLAKKLCIVAPYVINSAGNNEAGIFGHGKKDLTDTHNSKGELVVINKTPHITSTSIENERHCKEVNKSKHERRKDTHSKRRSDRPVESKHLELPVIESKHNYKLGTKVQDREVSDDILVRHDKKETHYGDHDKLRSNTSSDFMIDVQKTMAHAPESVQNIARLFDDFLKRYPDEAAHLIGLAQATLAPQISSLPSTTSGKSSRPSADAVGTSKSVERSDGIATIDKVRSSAVEHVDLHDVRVAANISTTSSLHKDVQCHTNTTQCSSPKPHLQRTLSERTADDKRNTTSIVITQQTATTGNCRSGDIKPPKRMRMVGSTKEKKNKKTTTPITETCLNLPPVNRCTSFSTVEPSCSASTPSEPGASCSAGIAAGVTNDIRLISYIDHDSKQKCEDLYKLCEPPNNAHGKSNVRLDCNTSFGCGVINNSLGKEVGDEHNSYFEPPCQSTPRFFVESIHINEDSTSPRENSKPINVVKTTEVLKTDRRYIIMTQDGRAVDYSPPRIMRNVESTCESSRLKYITSARKTTSNVNKLQRTLEPMTKSPSMVKGNERSENGCSGITEIKRDVKVKSDRNRRTEAMIPFRDICHRRIRKANQVISPSPSGNELRKTYIGNGGKRMKTCKMVKHEVPSKTDAVLLVHDTKNLQRYAAVHVAQVVSKLANQNNVRSWHAAEDGGYEEKVIKHRNEIANDLRRDQQKKHEALTQKRGRYRPSKKSLDNVIIGQSGKMMEIASMPKSVERCSSSFGTQQKLDGQRSAKTSRADLRSRRHRSTSAHEHHPPRNAITERGENRIDKYYTTTYNSTAYPCYEKMTSPHRSNMHSHRDRSHISLDRENCIPIAKSKAPSSARVNGRFEPNIMSTPTWIPLTYSTQLSYNDVRKTIKDVRNAIDVSSKGQRRITKYSKGYPKK